ncbi:MAG: ester cyclase [Anaerolineae bacterium]|nr:ester cyclase [Anaerolineae bacterium]NUQ06256.1 ester cyclase [Anaerolineae bacterium]
MTAANKQILRRHFEEVLNQGRLDVIDEIYADTYILDAPVQTDGSAQVHGQTLGRDGLKRRVTLFRTAFPDIHFTINDMVAEGDRVVVQYTFAGTHTGTFRELEPTGHSISVMGILIARVADDRIQSAVSVFDGGDMLHQLAPHHKSTVQILIDHLFDRVRDILS